ncbi:rCG33953, isoform CRA_a [Rattus norvegicus]|uniref:RCG33953, isoform CRA_a n=1 Tax=Rattus norvegicus TaxID=10116 RepID=A6HKE6_RAT|nr:rCG33953, isoform CRA_a [Rattus norvegicus]
MASNDASLSFSSPPPDLSRPTLWRVTSCLGMPTALLVLAFGKPKGTHR